MENTFSFVLSNTSNGCDFVTDRIRLWKLRKNKFLNDKDKFKQFKLVTCYIHKNKSVATFFYKGYIKGPTTHDSLARKTGHMSKRRIKEALRFQKGRLDLNRDTGLDILVVNSSNCCHMIQKGHVTSTATSCYPLMKAEILPKIWIFSIICWLSE